MGLTCCATPDRGSVELIRRNTPNEIVVSMVQQLPDQMPIKVACHGSQLRHVDKAVEAERLAGAAGYQEAYEARARARKEKEAQERERKEKEKRDAWPHCRYCDRAVANATALSMHEQSCRHKHAQVQAALTTI